ncbi:glucosamine 6-phosphate N-acetyltransferase isoform X4 [Physcomitrium patens]|uniref:Glucosamine 6-phosphate N-acetyltransferase n=2 Tax=Physcomitrium patens TaxID=3218 RepID=A0A7I4ATV2_PHYPA|nr:glucosamine 6-phosphate N-acetyltransferase-like isoform X4 [Physcomitrium patens]|eukprot:XP_024394346.1 glucosamine 6-phosphate N-acetyltransferase-like isoform X4 [Physcomitrella patens]
MADKDSERFVLRALAISDFDKGFMQLLGQLTVAGAVSEEQFGDTEKGQIIATGSVLIEHKFLRNCGKVGHIEDVVVDQTVRGQRLGQRIIESLTQFAKDKGCYKVILDCSVENAAFYEKCGYKRKEIQMAAYF